MKFKINKLLILTNLVFFFILIWVNSPLSLEYDLVTLYEVHSDWGGQESFTLQRIVNDPNGRIYVVYNSAAANKVAVRYSDDDGQNWTQDDPNGMTAQNNPSIAAKPSSTNISVAGVNAALTKGPRYAERTTAWPDGASLEVVEDASPFNCNNDTVQVLWENDGSNPWCVYRYASNGITFDYIECAKKSAGSWSNGTQLSCSVQPNSMSACMDDIANDNEAWAAWRGRDPNDFYIQTAYFDGNSWSSISTLDTVDDFYDMGYPIIRCLNDEPVVMWYTKGKGTNSSYYQGRYAKYSGGSWSSAANITDVARDNKFFAPFINNDDEICALYASYGIDPNHSNVYNMAYTCLSGGSWDDPIILTAEAKTLDAYSVQEEDDVLHILIRDSGNTKHYYAGFDISSAVVPSRRVIINIL